MRDNLTGQMSESQVLKFELECNTASARLLRSECDHVKEELNKVTGGVDSRRLCYLKSAVGGSCGVGTWVWC